MTKQVHGWVWIKDGGVTARRESDRQIDRQTDRHTDRQTDTQTYRHTDTQTDTQTDWQTEREDSQDWRRWEMEAHAVTHRQRQS